MSWTKAQCQWRSTMVYPVVLVVLLLAVCTGKEITLEIGQVVQNTSDKFISVQFDTGMIARHWQHLDFGSPMYATLTNGLFPAYVRIGGTVEDMLVFQPNGILTTTPSNMTEDMYWDMVYKLGRQPFVKFNMTGKQFDQLYHFFTTVANLRMVFGLNALLRIGKYWDPSNAIQFLDYSSKKGYKMDFQLGNEPRVHKYNFTVEPEDLGVDFLTLRKLLNSYPLHKTSQLMGPDSYRPHKKWIIQFLDEVVKHAAPVLDAVTWHQYYTDSRTATIDDFLDPSLLDTLPGYIAAVNRCVEKYKRNPVIWLGETGSTYGGGTRGLSDRYVAGFMWLDKLGISAKLGIDVVIRQSLSSGNYALIHHDKGRQGSFFPNPDYWLTYLYKVLVGRKVLNVTTSEDSKHVRMYAHCTNTKRSGYPLGSITVYGLNLLEEDATISLSSQLKGMPIEQFLLTPNGGNLRSRQVNLNGKKLMMIDEMTFPKMDPVIVKEIVLPAKTFGFFVLPKAAVPACLSP